MMRLRRFLGSEKGISTKVIAISLIIIVVVVSVAAYLVTLPTPTPGEYSLTISHPAGFVNLETAYAHAGTEIMLYGLLYDTLVSRKAGTVDVFEPGLATSWELSADKLVWTFHLRKGVKFHDGSEFKADSVNWTFARIMAIGTQPKSLLKFVKEVRIMDDYTVQMVLNEPYYPFIALMSSEAVFPIVGISAKQHEVAGDFASEWLLSHEMGSGPYKLKELKPNEYIIAEKFYDYWMGWKDTENNIKTVVIKTVLESTTLKLMLLRKELDIASMVLPEDVPELTTVEGLIVSSWPVASSSMLVLRARPGTPLDDIKLREAIAYAIDYDAFMTGILQGYTVKAESFIPKGLFGFESAWHIEQNITKAQEIMAATEYEPGDLKLTYVHNIGIPWKDRLGELLKDNLAKIGIDLEIVKVSWPTLVESLYNADAPYDLYAYYTTCIVPDALMLMRVHFHSESLAGDGYNKWHLDPILDGFIENAESAATNEEYLKQIGDAQQYISDNFICIFLTDTVNIQGTWEYVKGFKHSPLVNHEYNYYDLYIEK